MESKNRGNLNFANSADLYSLLANVVNRKNIINIGTICKVIDKNFVNVRLYNTDEYGDPIIISAVRLLHIGTSKFKITVSPAIGDNVLLLSGRDFIKTVEYDHTAEKKKEFAEPFGNATVQAILISPEEDDNNKTAISINEDGDITVESLGKIDISVKDSFSDSGNKLVDLVMDTSNELTLKTYSGGSAKNTIKMGSDGVTINDNLSISNS
jgi:hypothetical protein